MCCVSCAWQVQNTWYKLVFMIETCDKDHPKFRDTSGSGYDLDHWTAGPRLVTPFCRKENNFPSTVPPFRTCTDVSSRETTRKVFISGHLLTAGGICTVSPQPVCETKTDHHRTPEHHLGNPDENIFKRTCTKHLEEGLLKPSWNATCNHRIIFSASGYEACQFKLMKFQVHKTNLQLQLWLQTLILNKHKSNNSALLAFKKHLPFNPLRVIYIYWLSHYWGRRTIQCFNYLV